MKSSPTMRFGEEITAEISLTKSMVSGVCYLEVCSTVSGEFLGPSWEYHSQIFFRTFALSCGVPVGVKVPFASLCYFDIVTMDNKTFQGSTYGRTMSS